MNCKDWEERLALYAGGDLANEEAAQVERHLGECLGCQLFSSGLKESQELLQDFHREPLSPAHFAAVRARVLSELRPVGQTIVFRGLSAFWRPRWVLGFATVAAALLVALAVLPPVRSLWAPGARPKPQPPVVASEHPPAGSAGALAVGSAGALAAGAFVPSGDRGIPVTRPVRHETPSRNRRARSKAQPGEPLLIRMVSDDPDVVIYWIAETKGE